MRLEEFTLHVFTAMDFFDQQDRARRKTGLLLFYFGAAVVTTVLLVYLLPVLGWYFYRTNYGPREIQHQLTWWYPNLFLGVCSITLMVVGIGTLFKIMQLRRGGGEGVATLLGGRQVYPGTDDYFEKRLRNVVEEMAIASGVPVPPVYVLPKEKGINAFAAGFTPSDAVIAVTYGTMTGLTRDELQGIIAHEFSHVLNSDMATNIKLMGFLHGLLLIALTGRLILELGIYSDSKKGGLPILAAGVGLIGIGSCGMLFGKLIKSAISRSRERLADASAVQFTRNPAGLASALKKVGGLSEGSRLRSPNAAQASHMFFGNGMRYATFSTHPPLAERVRWLEPTFDGTFPAVTHEDLRKQLARFEGAPLKKEEKKPNLVDLFTDPSKLAVTATMINATARPVSPHALLESIGKPMEHHADAARALIVSIPEPVKAYARDPYGARMLVYFLLLDSDDVIRDKQMALIKQQADPEVSRILEKALLEIGRIAPEMRLPIIDLSIPALRFLSPGQYVDFRAIVNALIDADERVDVFEYALQRVLMHHLDPKFSGKVDRRPANYYSIRGLVHETSLLLSVLSRKGHANDPDASAAFLAAVKTINDPKTEFQFLNEEHCTWTLLDEALDKLNEGSAQLKKLVLAAALACLMHDREITVEEVELFRAIADTLGCPVPPWVIPLKIGE